MAEENGATDDDDFPVRLLHKDSSLRTRNLLSGNLSPFVQALLTDFYQLTMAYGYWKAGKHEMTAVFDLFFRKNPFQGEYTIFCGLEECLKFLETFTFTDSDIQYLRTIFPAYTEEGFFQYLQTVNARQISVQALPEGSVVFPKTPLITVQGPMAVCQLIETTLLNLSCGTNAARFRIAAGEDKSLLEFGLRRAQGPNGGLCASKYTYVGGFDGTSNVLAGKLFKIPVKGTMAHSFVSSFSDISDLKYVTEVCSLIPSVRREEVQEGELVAFVAYALAFPHGFLALIDTYDFFRSGLMNFCGVGLALWRLGYKAQGVRIDSGDLAYSSKEVRRVFKTVAKKYEIDWFGAVKIVASNDINEEILYSLSSQSHNIDAFGVGTHLVTCQKQPALGCVYKLVDVNQKPCIKLTQEVEKISLPGKKKLYRLFGKSGFAINDLLLLHDEEPPEANKPILCRHPFQESKRAYVTPSRVVCLHKEYWGPEGLKQPLPSLIEVKGYVKESLSTIRDDIKRHVNPTPYKVSVSEKLYDFLHSLWLQHAPIGQLE